VVEIMGRHAGWLDLWGGLAGGADVVLVPEETFDTNEVCEILKKKRAGGKKYSIVAVAEGALPRDAADFVTKDKTIDSFGHIKLGGIGTALAKEIEKRTGFETREVILGHLQRGGSPTAFDRVLGTRFGLKAIDLVHEKKFGYMVALRGNEIVPVTLEEAVAKLKTVPKDLLDLSKIFSL
jgi:6-phosphofructokinase